MGVFPFSKEEFVLNNSPLKKSFVLTGLLTIISVVYRLVQQFALIDHATGFYKATALAHGSQLALNALLLVSVVLIFLSVRRQREHFSNEPKQFSREFFICLIVMGFTAELSYLYDFLNELRGLFGGHGLYLPSALPAFIFVIGGVLLLYQGLLGISGKQENIDLLSASIMSLWGAAALVCTYLSHTIVYHVSDNMLHILAIAAMAFFMTNCLKYMMGTELAVCGRRAVHYGLFTVYFGVTLALPRLISIIVNGNTEVLGAPAFYDLIFVLAAAAVAAVASYLICFGKSAVEAESDEAVEEIVEESGSQE